MDRPVSVDVAFMRTRRGDELTVTLFQHAGEGPTICIAVDDADDCAVPTFEMTIEETTDFREILRKFGEIVQRGRGQTGLSRAS
jgi:hypothetical protein